MSSQKPSASQSVSPEPVLTSSDSPSAEGAVRPFVMQLRAAGQRYFEAVLNHSFMSELKAGSLSDERFVYFLVQDHHFLQSAARAFSQVVSRIKDDEWLVHFNKCSTEVLLLEKSVHNTFFERFALTAAQVSAMELAPTNEGYSSFLENLADRAPFEDALSALLPCFWFYRDIGVSMLQSQSLHPRFRAWAELYAGAAYSDMVEALLDLIEEVSVDATPAVRNRMESRFVHACRYEWMFWQMCYEMQRWPEP